METTNYNGKGWIATNVASGRIKGIPQSDALHVTERFTRVECEHDSVRSHYQRPERIYETLEGRVPLYQGPGAQQFGCACHEGNHAMANILSGARAGERAAKEAAKK